MNEKTQYVWNGFLKLNETEQAAFLEKLLEFAEMSDAQKLGERALADRKQVNYKVKMRLGPLSPPCTCCGRS